MLSILQRHHQRKQHLQSSTPSPVQSKLSQASSTDNKREKKMIVNPQSPLIIAVQENESSMQVLPQSLPSEYHEHILIVRSYAEAAGYIAAHKAGIDFEAITSHVAHVPITQL